jgi:hypothetical protein
MSSGDSDRNTPGVIAGRDPAIQSFGGQFLDRWVKPDDDS